MSDAVERIARVLRDATQNGTPVSPVRELLADADEAFAVQHHNVELAIRAGRRISGYKIGVTSAPAQEFFGITEPTYGVLFDDRLVRSGDSIDPRALIQPKLEGEVAVVLGTDLDQGGNDLSDVIAATSHVLPAIEVVDSRIANFDLTIVDMIADNAGSGLYVLGDTPVPLGDVDLAEIPMTMSVSGLEVSTGTGAACLGNPLNAVVWLANTLADRGTPLRAGAHIMTGALGPMVDMPQGATVHADFGPLGSVSTVWQPSPNS